MSKIVERVTVSRHWEYLLESYKLLGQSWEVSSVHLGYWMLYKV